VDYEKVGYPKPGCLGAPKQAGSLPMMGGATGQESGASGGGALQVHYASCLRIVDPVSFDTVYLQEFENRETVFSLFVS